MARRSGLSEVELLDESPPEPEAPRPRTGRRRWLVGAAVGVVLALGVTQWVVSARQDADAARLAQVPGVLTPVDEALEVVRPVTPAVAATLTEQAYGTLVQGPDGAQSYRWFEPDGRGWTTPLLGPNGSLADPTRGWTNTACKEPEPGQDRAVCLVTDGARILDGGRIVELGATTTEVAVLDTADGTVRARWPVVGGTSVATLPDDLVVVGELTDELVVVTAYDVLTGVEQWTHEEPWRPGPGDTRVVRAGDLVAFSTPDGTLTLLSPEGEVVRSGIDVSLVASEPGLLPGQGWALDPRDGILSVLGQAADGAPQTTLLAADGRPELDVTVDGQLLSIGVDDGSVPGLLLTSDEAVHAWDATSGAARWSLGAGTARSALVVRGRVFVTTDRAVVAVDGRSGREVWRSAELVGLMPSALLTDGTHVLVAVERTGTDGVPALIALEPASGTEVFRAPYPAGVTDVEALGRTLVGRDEESGDRVQLG